MIQSNAVFVTRTASWLHAIRAAIVLVLLCGGFYPLAVTTVGGLAFPYQATGSLVIVEGTAIGSKLVGQTFSAPKYFHGRPSAADYDPFSVGGSNLAASNPELVERVQQKSAAISMRDGVSFDQIPVDLLAASGSGIDPHISPAAAEIQATRIAAARGLPIETVLQMIADSTEAPSMGIFGQPRVNVLMINLALDNLEISH